MAIVWYIVEKTGSALQAGGIAIAVILGKLLGGISISFIIDKVKSKKIMIVSDLIRLMLMVFLFISINLEPDLSFSYFYIVAFIMSIFTACFSPTRSAVIPLVIKDESQLLNANAFDGTSQAIVQILSWFSGGIIIAFLGLEITIAINVVTFLISTILIIATTWSEDTKDKIVTQNRLDELFEGLSYLRKNNLLFRVVSFEAAYLLFLGLLWSALPIKVIELGGSGELYGYQGAAFGIGFLATSILLVIRKNRFVGKIYLYGIVIHLLGNFIAATSLTPVFLVLGVFIAGIGNSPWITGRQTLYQLETNEKVRGRIFAFVEISTSFVLFPAWVLGAYLTDIFGAREVMMFATTMQIFVVILLASNKIFKNYSNLPQTPGCNPPGK